MFQSQVESYQKLKKWYLMPPSLTLSIIRYGSRVKWNNPGKGVEPPLHLGVVAIEKVAFGSPSTTVANFTYTKIGQCFHINLNIIITYVIYIMQAREALFTFLSTHPHAHTYTHIHTYTYRARKQNMELFLKRFFFFRLIRQMFGKKR